MIFNTKAAQKNAGQKLTDHYLLNELCSDLDEISQAAVSGGGDSVRDAYANSFTYTVVNQGNYERGSSGSSVLFNIKNSGNAATP